MRVQFLPAVPILLLSAIDSHTRFERGIVSVQIRVGAPKFRVIENIITIIESKGIWHGYSQ